MHKLTFLNYFLRKVSLFFLSMVIVNAAIAQSRMPVSFYAIEDQIRSYQLTDSPSYVNSFCIRPYVFTDSSNSIQSPWNLNTNSKNKLSKWQILPLTMSLQYNSAYPFERNDGSLIPAAGLQTFVTSGVYFKSKRWQIQIKPEFVFAANQPYEGFRREHDSLTWSTYYEWLNNSDIPEKFGQSNYNRIFPGQSSIRYQSDKVTYALSTENLWWGPGIYNSLVLSNQGPGFLHLSIGSRKPWHTKIGTIEWQVIGGTLFNSGQEPPGTDITFNGSVLYKPKMESSRYATGLAFTWQPKWIKGLFLGFSKMSYQYFSDISGTIDILPLAGVFGQKVSKSEKENKKATLSAVFFRYLMPEEKAEVYLEFGFGDRVITPFNFISSESIPKAYTGGIRKLIALGQKNRFIQLTTEITQMQLDKPSLIRGNNSWYTHTYIRQGYTNDGQYLGSSIGSGSNSQHLDISYINHQTKTGIGFERIVRNNDFYYKRYEVIKDYRRHWVDLSIYLHTAGWEFNKLRISGELTYTSSINYKWYILKDDIYRQYENGNDLKNLQLRLTCTYPF